MLCSECIEARLRRRMLVASHPHALHGGAGDARNGAINVRIAANV
jgi:hypothetical protein